MDAYDELLTKLGLLHLKDRPDELRDAVLRELGLFDLRDNPAELSKKLAEQIELNKKRLDDVRKDVGELIQHAVMKRGN